jgi:glycosyltransferase involved in cell wall biosynthesis
LLEGIRQQSVQDVEIVVVDSGSTDRTVAVAEASGARVVRIPAQEFTFGRSLNLGIQAATRELIVIASAHVYPVYPDWLESLLRPFEDEKIALTYGKQRGPGTAQFSEQQIYLQWYPDRSSLRQPTSFCNNANAAIRRSLWARNPYNESLTGLEDLAWGKWAREQGYAIAYIAEAEVVHIHNETLQGIFNRYRREGMAFKQIYPEAHFSLYDFVRLTITNILSDFWHAARQRLLWSNMSSILQFRLAQFHGTRMGYRESGLLTPHLRATFYYARERKPKEDLKRNVEPIQYNLQESMINKTWKFLGIAHDYDEFEINKIHIWSHKWHPLHDQFARVKDPAYGKEFIFQVYLIEAHDKRVEFAAGEFSSNVWGVYVHE